MKLLADENVPGAAVQALRDAGHDLLWIRESHPGMADPDILQIAVSESRVLLTFDKDFGELAFKLRFSASSGIILFRWRKAAPDIIARRAVDLIAARTDWTGHFAVI